MVRRGPDDEGYWDDGRCFLGFRRLAILDLTPAGHQPMVSGDGRSVIVFNGELYNFPELKRELEAEGVRFRSRSDTEVVLEALNRWGEGVVGRFNGMFAFAWYSIAGRRLVLGRDHAGIKPLFYRIGPGDGQVSFASQLNCLVLPAMGGEPRLRLDALGLYLRLNYCPAPYTIYEDIWQLPAGHILTVEANGERRLRQWWGLPEAPEPVDGKTLLELDERLESAIDNAVRRQRVADVPVGVFLSGGVDSPLVAAVSASQRHGAVRTYTIGMPGWAHDESGDAKRYAQILGCAHKVHEVGETEALALVDEVAQAQVEPFSDYSMLPTMLVSRLAREDVIVALSGDGGDELFFGYERPHSLWRNGMDFRYPLVIRRLLYYSGRLGLGTRRSSAIVHRDPGDYYFTVNSRFGDDHFGRLPREMQEVPEDFRLYEFRQPVTAKTLADFSRRVEYSGQLQRVLRKVDMASMHYSLEVRVPLLDREVIEASLAYDGAEELRSGQRKRALRRLLAKHVGEDAIPQHKRGFGVPLAKWLRGALRERVEDELLGRGARVAELLGRPVVQAMWEEHQSGKRSHHWAIYSMLSLEWWWRVHVVRGTG
ncbi:MAG: asparagine synthetase B [Bryobacteraceae bacterium]|nr:MAG: asparagine synthetase B [Bryobacteraceae bacterium]